jgi:hypothetical protein
MMGTLATLVAGKKIPTPEDRYWTDVEGDVENVNNVLKITQIRATYHLKAPIGRVGDAREAFSSYLQFCPAAKSVIGCIHIRDNIVVEELSQ